MENFVTKLFISFPRILIFYIMNNSLKWIEKPPSIYFFPKNKMNEAQPSMINFPWPSASAGDIWCAIPFKTLLSQVILTFGEAKNLHVNITCWPITASISPESDNNCGLNAEIHNVNLIKPIQPIKISKLIIKWKWLNDNIW